MIYTVIKHILHIENHIYTINIIYYLFNIIYIIAKIYKNNINISITMIYINILATPISFIIL